MAESLRGASATPIRAALRATDPLPGLDGFAGRLPDGRLVRDALGREPLFVDGEAWALDSRSLGDPEPFPAGSVGTPGAQPTGRLTIPRGHEADPTVARERLGAAVDAALEAVPPGTPVGFSGGLDSGLVATASGGPLYVVGLSDAPDVAAAREAAVSMERSLRVVELSLRDVEDAVPRVARAIGLSDPMDVAIATGFYQLGTAIAADGHDHVALGQGADELFAGYQKVASAPTDDRLTAETVRDARDEMLQTIPHQAARDVTALRAAGVEPITPLLTDRVVSASLELPSSMLVRDGVRKWGLREIARDRLPTDVVDRKKTAMQYGSRISREIDRLARQAGFKRREPDHVRRYIQARLEGT